MCLALASVGVEASFLNANLNEELCIWAPPGMESLPEKSRVQVQEESQYLNAEPGGTERHVMSVSCE